jgi:mannosyltransferase
MEATAAARQRLAGHAFAIRRLVAERSSVFWIVAGLTGLAAVLRFWTLGLQSFHHDEVVTAGRVVRASLWHMLDKVVSSESVPPLYYLLAWPWAKVAGTGAIGLRSLSAVAGVATIPLVYLAVAELRDSRAGIAAAALVATNPMLIWYSQEARGYALLVLLCTASLLFFARGLRREGTRDLVCWAVVSALALCTHYFAAFPIAAEALVLARARRRDALPALAGLGAACAALAPLAVIQTSHADNTDWIGKLSLSYRLGEAGVAFMIGETGYLIAEPVRPLLGLVPLVLVAAAFALLALRGERSERRSAGLFLAIAAATLLIPLLLAVLGKDFFLDRNLIPALVPLLAALGIAVTVRRARRAGAVLCYALVVYWLGFWVATGFTSSLQRPPYRSVAIELGEPDGPRATVTWLLGMAPLRHYLGTHAIQADPEGETWFVHEIEIVSSGATLAASWRPAAGFQPAGTTTVGRLRITRYVTKGLRYLPVRALQDADTGFRSNRVLLDGIGPEL